MDPYRYGFRVTNAGITAGFRGLHNPTDAGITAIVYPINGVGETYGVRINAGDTIPVVGYRVVPSATITALK
jgi:hypothetical protein